MQAIQFVSHRNRDAKHMEQDEKIILPGNVSTPGMKQLFMREQMGTSKNGMWILALM